LPKAESWQMTSDNEYSTTFQFRRRTSSVGFGPAIGDFSRAPRVSSQAAEITLTIQNNDDAVVVSEILYLNGIKTDWVTWELDK